LEDYCDEEAVETSDDDKQADGGVSSPANQNKVAQQVLSTYPVDND
jgi:hypothetical protein